MERIEFLAGEPFRDHDIESAPEFFSADARISRDFKLTPKRSIRVSVSSFNLTNHWNMAEPATGLFFGERYRRFPAGFDVLF